MLSDAAGDTAWDAAHVDEGSQDGTGDRSLRSCARLAFLRRELTSSPLEAVHSFPVKARLAAMYFRLQDDLVSRQARLPRSGSIAHARAWIVAQRAAGVRLYAAGHPDHGMIGAFAISPMAYVATFHYWLGAQFRGMGYARPVLARLQAEALAAGIRRLYSPVDPDNEASLRALRGIGFRTIGTGLLLPAPAMQCVVWESGTGARDSASQDDLCVEAAALFNGPQRRPQGDNRNRTAGRCS